MKINCEFIYLLFESHVNQLSVKGIYLIPLWFLQVVHVANNYLFQSNTAIYSGDYYLYDTDSDEFEESDTQIVTQDIDITKTSLSPHMLGPGQSSEVQQHTPDITVDDHPTVDELDLDPAAMPSMENVEPVSSSEEGATLPSEIAGPSEIAPDESKFTYHVIVYTC